MFHIKSVILTSNELAEKLDIEPKFRATTRIRRIMRQAGETACDFQLSFGDYINFSQWKIWTVKWILGILVFLYSIKKIPKKPDFLKLCGDLQLKLTVGSQSEIDGCMLCDELVILKSFLPDNNVITPGFLCSCFSRIPPFPELLYNRKINQY